MCNIRVISTRSHVTRSDSQRSITSSTSVLVVISHSVKMSALTFSGPRAFTEAVKLPQGSIPSLTTTITPFYCVVFIVFFMNSVTLAGIFKGSNVSSSVVIIVVWVAFEKLNHSL
jgi:hypothetical protein